MSPAARAAAPPAISVDRLSFAYPDGREVISGASFELAGLDFASVIGPNGGGKTTLLRLILGLLEPTSGTIRVLGTTPERARGRVGYLPQQAILDPHFPISVIEVVLMGRIGATRRFGPYSRRDREAAREALARVGLAAYERQPFSTLSGGERQRVLVARALASEPELLLLDEPSAGLDQRVEHDFFELLAELNRSMTIVLVSHDLGFVSRWVRTVVCVRRSVRVHPTSAVDGKVIAEVYGEEVRMVRHDHQTPGGRT